MTTPPIPDLKALAEAATPGRREFGENGVLVAPDAQSIVAIVRTGVMGPMAEDVDFWTTFDPPTVLALLSDLERKTKALEETSRLARIWLQAMETGRSEPLFIARDETKRVMANIILHAALEPLS